MAIELGNGYFSIVAETSKFAPSLRDALKNAEGDVEQQSQGLGGRILSGIGAGILAAGGLAAAFAVGRGFYGAIDRVLNIEDATAKLVGLGHEAETVDQIMQNALDSVSGTAFGLDAAATVAASAVAAGIKPGEDLTNVLALVADAATIAGTDMGSMGSIFNKVAASNKIQGDVIAQLQDQGIPVLQFLAQEMGVTAEEAAELASAGKVNFEIFRQAMENGLGGAAQASGETTRGAFANLGAAVSRVGAQFITLLLPGIKLAIAGLTDFANQVGARVGPAIEGAGEALRSFVGWVRENQTAIKVVAGIIGTLLIPVLIRAGVAATVSAARQVAAWVVTQAQAIKSAAIYVAQSYRIIAAWVMMGVRAMANAAIQVLAWAILGTASAIHAARMAASWVVGVIAPAAAATAAMVANVARQVAAWVLLGVQSLVQAARVAAAWLIAMGPIGLVIAAVVGLVALIIANWDKIRDFTVKVWGNITSWLSQQWTNIKNTAVSVWNAVVSFITGIPGRVLSALSGLGNTLRSNVSTWFGNAKQAAVDKFNSLVDWVKGIPGRVVSALGNVGRLLYNAGANILSGFLDGLKSGWSAVTGWVGGIGSWIADNKGPKAYDLALLVPAGRWIMQGLQAGLESETESLGRTLQGVSDVIAGQRFAAATPALLGSAVPVGYGGTGGPQVQQNIYPQPGQSEEAIGAAAARRLNFSMQG